MRRLPATMVSLAFLPFRARFPALVALSLIVAAPEASARPAPLATTLRPRRTDTFAAAPGVRPVRATRTLPARSAFSDALPASVSVAVPGAEGPEGSGALVPPLAR